MFRSIDLRKHLLGVMVVFGFLLYAFYAGHQSPADTASHSAVPELAPAEAKALVDAGAVIVDVREKPAFDARHIPGAILITLEELRRAIPERLAAAKDKPILIYCGDGLTGPEGTTILNKAGYAKAVNLKGGIEAWAKAGMPTQKAG